MTADEFASTLGTAVIGRRYRLMTGEKILGIEGGGTKTAWAMVADGASVESGNLPPSNLRVTPLDQITKIFRVLPRDVVRIGGCLAGRAAAVDRAAAVIFA